MTDEDRRPLWWRLAPLAVLVVLAAVAFQQGWHQSLSLERLIDAREELVAFVEAHFVAGVALFLLAMIVVVALTIPGATALTIISGPVFGWPLGGLLAAAGATAGSAIMFVVAQTGFGRTLARRLGPRLERLRAGFERNALSYVLTLRLIALVPFWLVTLAAAFLGVRLRTFVLGTAIGTVPLTVMLAIIGEGLDAALLRRQRELEACLAAGRAEVDCEAGISVAALVPPEMLAALAVMVALAVLPAVIRGLRQRRVRGVRC